MTYYNIEIVSTAEQTAKGLFDFPSRQAAIMAFHQAIAAAMANPKVINGLFMVMDERGAIVAMEQFEADEPAPVAVK